jgi:hypothetical protein
MRGPLLIRGKRMQVDVDDDDDDCKDGKHNEVPEVGGSGRIICTGIGCGGGGSVIVVRV